MTQPAQLITCLDYIDTQLNAICHSESSLSDPSIKRGWLQHIFQNQDRLNIQFPVIAYRPELSNTSQSHDNKASNDEIVVVIDGAVSVKDTDEPVDDLINMLKDVRVALAIDPATPRIPFSNMTFGACAFDLPEAGEPYAFFSQKLTLKIIEELC